MLAATQQQLALVTSKATQLESDVQREIQSLKELKTRKKECEKTVMDLRERLLHEERHFSEVSAAHDQTEESLRKCAREYQRAQLLQKKLSNTLKDICGHNRCVVSVMKSFPPTPSGGIDERFIKVPDECTVILPSLRKTFIVDSATIVCAPSRQQQVSPRTLQYQQQNQIPSIVEDSLRGFNYSLFSLSAVAGTLTSSWTPVMFSSPNISSTNQFHDPSNGTAIIDAYATYLFDNLESLGITHFNMRCTFVELTMSEGNVDLLDHQGGPAASSPILPVGLGTVSAVLCPAARQGSIQSHDVKAEASSLPIRSLGEMADIIRIGLLHRNNRLKMKYDRIAHTPHAQQPSPTPEALVCMFGGHLVFTLYIESFDSRGHFRKSTVIFTETSPILLENEGNRNMEEQSWARKCTGALTDVISMASAASIAKQQQHHDGTNQAMSIAAISESIATTLSTLVLPHQKNRLVQLLQPCFGGNCKSVLYCSIPSAEADSTALTSSSLSSIANILAYAHYFKNTCHRAVPYDLSPELQSLAQELNVNSPQHPDTNSLTTFSHNPVLYNQHSHYIDDDVDSATGMIVSAGEMDSGRIGHQHPYQEQSCDTIDRDTLSIRATVQSVAERERQQKSSDRGGSFASDTGPIRMGSRWKDIMSDEDGRYYLQ